MLPRLAGPPAAKDASNVAPERVTKVGASQSPPVRRVVREVDFVRLRIHNLLCQQPLGVQLQLKRDVPRRGLGRDDVSAVGYGDLHGKDRVLLGANGW